MLAKLLAVANCTEENSMALYLPEPVTEYLSAEEANYAVPFLLLTEDGTVHDEGQIITVRYSDPPWKQASEAKFRYVPADCYRSNVRRLF